MSGPHYPPYQPVSFYSYNEPSVYHQQQPIQRSDYIPDPNGFNTAYPIPPSYPQQPIPHPYLEVGYHTDPRFYHNPQPPTPQSQRLLHPEPTPEGYEYSPLTAHPAPSALYSSQTPSQAQPTFPSAYPPSPAISHHRINSGLSWPPAQQQTDIQSPRQSIELSAVAAPPVPTAPVPTKPVIKFTFKANRGAVPPEAPVSHYTVGPSHLAMRSSGRDHGGTVVKTEPIVASSSRPVREARLQAQQQITQISRDDDEDEDADFGEDDRLPVGADHSLPGETHPVDEDHHTRSGRTSRKPQRFEEPVTGTSPDAGSKSRGKLRKRIVDPDDEDGDAFFPSEDVKPAARFPFPARTRASLAFSSAPETRVNPANGNGILYNGGRHTRSTDKRDKSRHSSADAESFAPSGSASPTGDEDASDDPLDRGFEHEEEYSPSPHRRQTRSQAAPRRSTRASARAGVSSEEEYGGPKRQLRERISKVNYQLPPLDISAELVPDHIAAIAGPGRRRPNGVGFAGGTRFGAGAAGGLPWNVRGWDLARAMGDADTSDSDLDFATPIKAGAAGPSAIPAGGGSLSRPVAPTDVPNFGRVNPKSTLADADPLGVDVNVTFDQVGGLDDHINQLKEMVALPLLYPELFQQFGITPPRGVLFHGPPGTGKTLLARALAASCSTGNTKIAFFMRKGADVLSKWVGEAERQLRMLFEEARAAQPSIIFFDEIDGLAPVRSSKQDQIHASLVSTLLALMDGMDGRGQVIVIGATNRPDAVDSALRRPGRFDREFYFPLPNKEARKKIIGINTRDWAPPLRDGFLNQLATLTKGYGGADLRALCTEAALNAVQRRYPQIYRTTDRLLLQPESIQVGAKDFMMSIKKIVPSSARSTASPAVQLPLHLVPLLAAPFERLKAAVDAVLPSCKQKTALEEAEFEDEGTDDFERHTALQSLGTMRTYRPRILVHGQSGLGQSYLGPAILHHLEGFHVQSLDLGSLMGDSTRTVEAALVQLFVEAKRHQPSILFIPSLGSWALTMSDTARATFQALLDGVNANDPVLLLAISDGGIEDIPRDVRAWFGYGKDGKVLLSAPCSDERSTYFADLLNTLSLQPTDFQDALPRRKRVFETLPLAPPLPPRQATEAELQREIDRDLSARNMMVLSFTALVQEFLKKFRRVATTVKEDALRLTRILETQVEAAAEAAALAVEAAAAAASSLDDPLSALPNGLIPVTTPAVDVALPGSQTPGHTAIPATTSQPVPARTTVWQAHDVDLDLIQHKLTRHKYYVPQDFLNDIAKMEENVARLGDPDRQARIAEMAANARVHVSGFDPKWTPEFDRYKVRMLARKAEKQKNKEEAASQAVVTDEVATSGSLKRVREDDGHDVRGGKRHRSLGLDSEPDTGASPLTPLPTSGNFSINSLGGSSHLLPAVPNASGPLHSGTVDHSHVEGISSLRSGLNAIPSVPSPRQLDVPYPPFHLPGVEVSQLAQDLKVSTRHLNVDQLEQLRAMMFDKIWRGRGEWDKTHVVRGMVEALAEYAEEVQRGVAG